MLSSYVLAIKNSNIPERLILIVAFSSLLNPILSIPIHIGFFIYLFLKDEIVILFKSHQLLKWLLIILFVSIGLSLFYGNVVGYLYAIWFLLLVVFTAYCYHHLNFELSDFILRHILHFSIYLAIYGCFQYVLSYFIEPNAITSFTGLDNHRAIGTFLNANYYAIMIQFFVLLAIYMLLIGTTQKRMYYLFIIGINLLALLLTGSRAGLGAVLIGATVLILLVVPRFIGPFLVFVGSSLTLITLFVPELLVRFGSIAAGFLNRNEILFIGLARFLRNPFFGEGLFTISNVLHPLVRKIKTIHSHNLFLEPFINFGLIPLILFFPAYKIFRRDLFVIKNQGGSFYKLTLAFMVMILVHGTVDLPFFFPPFLILLVILVLGRTPRSYRAEDMNDSTALNP